MELQFRITGQTLERTEDFKIVSDSRNYLTAAFSFDEELPQGTIIEYWEVSA